MKTINDIISSIEFDEWMMEVLRAAQSLNLPDWWICAGFVRSKIWDTLHGIQPRTPMSDVDLIYFDSAILDEEMEKEYENQLEQIFSDVPWSVKNQARMHLVNQIPPYASSVDAISKFPETVTALGVKLNDNGQVLLSAPHGIDDVLNMEVKPTSYFLEKEERVAIYKKRIKEKKWSLTWNNVKILY
ncbi:nucleotidyltransferase family protein [Salinibacillus xinjiangensis]|uniref:Nucleotidyltransferase family protein n=1 Tax=Salinibacillus xinjiangensis TaxID=1229268 RepID=A0A6G1XC88_9BACI|nr:nucleotidyltransferase family protein [Salinibacillus xinjiangensis]MRG88398.1 hypothetical protein [Salinibacillus xinjiangensis]